MVVVYQSGKSHRELTTYDPRGRRLWRATPRIDRDTDATAGRVHGFMASLEALGSGPENVACFSKEAREKRNSLRHLLLLLFTITISFSTL